MLALTRRTGQSACVSNEADVAWSSILAPSVDPNDWPWEATARWVRFYSHPDGGQNPTTPAEYEEVVRSVTTIIDEAWSDDDEVMLVTGNVSEPGPSPVQSESQIAVQPGAVPWQEVLDSNGMEGEDEDVWSWQLWVSWHSRGNLLLDQLIRKVEDKEVEFVTLVMPNARVALHPYDGGIDVLLPTSEHRDRWRRRHARWVSQRPDLL